MLCEKFRIDNSVSKEYMKPITSPVGERSQLERRTHQLDFSNVQDLQQWLTDKIHLPSINNAKGITNCFACVQEVDTRIELALNDPEKITSRANVDKNTKQPVVQCLDNVGCYTYRLLGELSSLDNYISIKNSTALPGVEDLEHGKKSLTGESVGLIDLTEHFVRANSAMSNADKYQVVQVDEEDLQERLHSLPKDQYGIAHGVIVLVDRAWMLEEQPKNILDHYINFIVTPSKVFFIDAQSNQVFENLKLKAVHDNQHAVAIFNNKFKYQPNVFFIQARPTNGFAVKPERINTPIIKEEPLSTPGLVMHEDFDLVEQNFSVIVDNAECFSPFFSPLEHVNSLGDLTHCIKKMRNEAVDQQPLQLRESHASRHVNLNNNNRFFFQEESPGRFGSQLDLVEKEPISSKKQGQSTKLRLNNNQYCEEFSVSFLNADKVMTIKSPVVGGWHEYDVQIKIFKNFLNQNFDELNRAKIAIKVSAVGNIISFGKVFDSLKEFNHYEILQLEIENMLANETEVFFKLLSDKKINVTLDSLTLTGFKHKQFQGVRSMIHNFLCKQLVLIGAVPDKAKPANEKMDDYRSLIKYFCSKNKVSPKHFQAINFQGLGNDCLKLLVDSSHQYPDLRFVPLDERSRVVFADLAGSFKGNSAAQQEVTTKKVVNNYKPTGRLATHAEITKYFFGDHGVSEVLNTRLEFLSSANLVLYPSSTFKLSDQPVVDYFYPSTLLKLNNRLYQYEMDNLMIADLRDEQAENIYQDTIAKWYLQHMPGAVLFINYPNYPEYWQAFLNADGKIIQEFHMDLPAKILNYQFSDSLTIEGVCFGSKQIALRYFLERKKIFGDHVSFVDQNYLLRDQFKVSAIYERDPHGFLQNILDYPLHSRVIKTVSHAQLSHDQVSDFIGKYAMERSLFCLVNGDAFSSGITWKVGEGNSGRSLDIFIELQDIQNLKANGGVLLSQWKPASLQQGLWIALSIILAHIKMAELNIVHDNINGDQFMVFHNNLLMVDCSFAKKGRVESGRVQLQSPDFYYSSPEKVVGPYDYRSDTYALAVLIADMLSAHQVTAEFFAKKSSVLSRSREVDKSVDILNQEVSEAGFNFLPVADFILNQNKNSYHHEKLTWMCGQLIGHLAAMLDNNPDKRASLHELAEGFLTLLLYSSTASNDFFLPLNDTSSSDDALALAVQYKQVKDINNNWIPVWLEKTKKFQQDEDFSPVAYFNKLLFFTKVEGENQRSECVLFNHTY